MPDMVSIPFATDGWIASTELKGLTVGDTFVDGRGRRFRLFELALVADLAGSAATTSGDVLVLKDATTVTNDVSKGADPSNPAIGGVILGAIDGSSATETKCVLCLVEGEATINCSSGVALSSGLIADSTADGKAVAATAAEPGRTVGVALAAVVGGTASVLVMVS